MKKVQRLYINSLSNLCSLSNKQKIGVTLTEILIAFLILTMATFGALGIISYGHMATSKDYKYILALQLLEKTMNHLIQNDYSRFDQFLSGRQSVSVDSGSLFGIPFGNVTEGRESYFVRAVISYFPVTFFYRPINISNTVPPYDPRDPSTWRFSDVTSNFAVFNGSSLPYRVIQVSVRVSWQEQRGNVNKAIDATSYVVNLE